MKKCNRTQFRIGSLNVCGLKKRAEYPDFIDMVESFDLICFSESKIDDTDVISFPGYCNIAQPKKQKFLRKSGGISVYLKNKWEITYVR